MNADIHIIEVEVYGFKVDVELENPQVTLSRIAQVDKNRGLTLNQSLARLERKGREAHLSDEQLEYIRKTLINAW